ncbi:MAG: hypothetical protein RSF40_03560 [Oscillospiraceae bacterium]
MNINVDNVTEIINQEKRVTLVCVTNQFNCERIIKSGRVISNLSKTKLQIISVVSPDYPQNPEALEFLYRVSKENNGIMNVEYSATPLKTIIKYIKQNKISNVLTGVPTTDDSIIYKIWSKFTHINFFTVEEDGEIKEAKTINSAKLAR